VNVIKACRIPLASGLKTVDTEHVAPAAREAGQVFAVIKKSFLSFPVMVTLLMAAAVVPVFATVVLCAALVFPVVVTGYVKDTGVKVNVVAAPASVV
jgi:hypothetical protein